MQNNLEKNIDFLKINLDFVLKLLRILQRVVLLFLVLIQYKPLDLLKRSHF